MSFTPRTLGSNKFRLNANSTREISEAFERLAARYGFQHTFQSRKLKTGPMLNVVALHFLLLPEDARIALLRETIPKLEALLENEEDLVGFLEQVDTKHPSWSAAREAIVAPPEQASGGQTKRSG
jgi:hypothetical protein